jgi:Flp pilus assembly protein TadB
VIGISEQIEQFISKLAPNLKVDLRIAQMDTNVAGFVIRSLVLSLVFSVNFSVIFFFILLKLGVLLLLFPVFILAFCFFFFICLRIPKMNQAIVRKDIESNIFTLGGMLLTLLETGDSVISAFEGVSESNTKAGKYFGRIASEIYLGKNIDQAVDDAMKYTPSDSFRRLLEPIKISIKTGTDMHKPLTDTLRELSHEKVVEIENYQKKLSPFSMLYMMVGTIMPAIGVVGFVIIMSLMGVKLDFFPFLFLLLIGILIVQLIFIKAVQDMRPLVKL